MANPRSLVAMKIDRVHGQSEKAVEVRAYGKVAWLPKSQLHKEDVRWLQSMIGSEHGEDVQIDVPRWLFDKWKQPADDEPQSAPEKSRTVERRPRSHSDASLPPPPPPYDCGPLPPMAPDFGEPTLPFDDEPLPGTPFKAPRPPPAIADGEQAPLDYADALRELTLLSSATPEQATVLLMYEALRVAPDRCAVFDALLTLHVEFKRSNLPEPSLDFPPSDAFKRAKGLFAKLFG